MKSQPRETIIFVAKIAYRMKIMKNDQGDSSVKYQLTKGEHCVSFVEFVSFVEVPTVSLLSAELLAYSVEFDSG